MKLDDSEEITSMDLNDETIVSLLTNKHVSRVLLFQKLRRQTNEINLNFILQPDSLSKTHVKHSAG